MTRETRGSSAAKSVAVRDVVLGQPQQHAGERRGIVSEERQVDE